MKTIKQIGALLQMSFYGIGQRFGSVLVTMVSTTCVVGVLVSMLSMGVGARQMMMQNLREDRAVILSHGAASPNQSSLTKDTVLAIIDMPGIKKGADGKPLASADTAVLTEGRKKSDNSRANFPLYGVDSNYVRVYSELRLIDGRMFQPGLHEVIVGKSRWEQTKGLEIGDHIKVRGSQWTVVGHYEVGRFLDLNMISDVDTVKSAARREVYNQVTVVLESPAAYDKLQAAIKANPSIDVELKHEIEMVKANSKSITGILDFIGYFVGGVMAIGATLGAMNAMYAVVDSRKREIATLRAIGFRSTPIVASVLIEALLLSLPGALLGAAVAWFLFNGNSVSPVGISFKLAVTPALAMVGIMWALTMGVLGGLSPALRAGRVSVATALRAV